MPLTLEQFKKEFPVYNDVPDIKLAGALYDKFYANKGLERPDFFKIIEVERPPIIKDIESTIGRIGSQLQRIEDEGFQDFAREAKPKGFKIPEPILAKSIEVPEVGLRIDNTPKGKGFFGVLKRPDGGISTEISATLGLIHNGKDVLLPLLVPTLTKGERNFLLTIDETTTAPLPEKIRKKAFDHAKKRIEEGKSPFFNEQDDVSIFNERRIGKKIFKTGRDIARGLGIGKAKKQKKDTAKQVIKGAIEQMLLGFKIESFNPIRSEARVASFLYTAFGKEDEIPENVIAALENEDVELLDIFKRQGFTREFFERFTTKIQPSRFDELTSSVQVPGLIPFTFTVRDLREFRREIGIEFGAAFASLGEPEQLGLLAAISFVWHLGKIGLRALFSKVVRDVATTGGQQAIKNEILTNIAREANEIIPKSPIAKELLLETKRNVDEVIKKGGAAFLEKQTVQTRTPGTAQPPTFMQADREGLVFATIDLIKRGQIADKDIDVVKGVIQKIVNEEAAGIGDEIAVALKEEIKAGNKSAIKVANKFLLKKGKKPPAAGGAPAEFANLEFFKKVSGQAKPIVPIMERYIKRLKGALGDNAITEIIRDVNTHLSNISEKFVGQKDRIVKTIKAIEKDDFNFFNTSPQDFPTAHFRNDMTNQEKAAFMRAFDTHQQFFINKFERDDFAFERIFAGSVVSVTRKRSPVLNAIRDWIKEQLGEHVIKPIPKSISKRKVIIKTEGQIKRAAQRKEFGKKPLVVGGKQVTTKEFRTEVDKRLGNRISAPTIKNEADLKKDINARLEERGAGFNPFTILPKSWRTKAQEFWTPFSTLSKSDQILSARSRGRGGVRRAEDFIAKLKKRIDAHPMDTRKEIFRFLDDTITLSDLRPDVRPLAQSIRSASDRIGRALVSRGLLDQKAFDILKGKYVHYIYAKNIIGIDVDIDPRLLVTPTGQLDMSYLRSRNLDLTAEDKQALGLIEDAGVAVPVGMGKALTDIAKFDYLSSIAKPEMDIVWLPSVIKVGNKTWGIGKLLLETKKQSLLVVDNAKKGISNDAAIKRLKFLEDLTAKATKATKEPPSEFRRIPDNAKFGNLAGAFVRKPVFDDIMPLVVPLSTNAGVGKALQTFAGFNAQITGLFKAGKVALNPPTMFRNAISNVLQNNMRGRNLAFIPGDFISAVQSMIAKDSHWVIAKRHGLFETNWTVGELNEVLKDFKSVNASNWLSFLEFVGKISKFYGKIDDIAKFTIYKQLRTSGKLNAFGATKSENILAKGSDLATIDEAILEAQKWGMDYSLASRSIKHLRRQILPFSTYQYKIAPLIIESLAKRPWVIGKYMAFLGIGGFSLAQELVKDYFDIDDKEWEKLLKKLPSYIKTNQTFAPLPWKSPEGKWQWVNGEYFMPWGTWMSMFRDLGSGELAEAFKALGIGNPLLSVFQALNSAGRNRPPIDPFTKQPIYNLLDKSPQEKYIKIMAWLSNQIMPSIFENIIVRGSEKQGAIKTTLQIVKSKITGKPTKDKWGNTLSISQAIGRWFGFNIIVVNPKQTRIIQNAKINVLKRELTKKAIKKRTGLLSREDIKGAVQRLKEKVERIKEGD